MSDQKPASEILDGLKPPAPGHADDQFKDPNAVAEAIRRGEEQARRQRELVDRLNGGKR